MLLNKKYPQVVSDFTYIYDCMQHIGYGSLKREVESIIQFFYS